MTLKIELNHQDTPIVLTTYPYMVEPDGYVPGVANIRDDWLGNCVPYTNVTDQLRVIVQGNTRDDVLNNVNAIVAQLSQAKRWARGEIDQPVFLRCQIGTGRVWESAIVDATITYAADAFHTMQRTPPYMVIDVQLERTGWWNENSISLVSATTNSAAQPAVVSATFSVSFTPATPMESCQITLTTSGTNPWIGPGYLLKANHANAIAFLEGEATTDMGTSTVVADTTNNARGGSIRRVTGTQNLRWSFTGPSEITQSSLISVWGAFRLTATGEYRVSPFLRINDSYTISGPYTVITSINPQVYFLGTFSKLEGIFHSIDRFGLSITQVSGTPSLDIDYFAFLSHDYGGQVLFIDKTSTLSSMSGNRVITIQPAYPYQIAPIVTFGSSTNRVIIPYRGDAMFMMNGDTVAYAWIATDANNTTTWRDGRTMSVQTQMVRGTLVLT